MKITFATYNICHCGDFESKTSNELPVNIEKTANTIKGLGVDIIGLNEVYDKGEIDCYNLQTDKLASKSDMPYYVFGEGTSFSWGATIGNAVLSKYPIKSVKIYPVPTIPAEKRAPLDKGWYEDRVIVKVTVDVGKEIDIISTHFGLNKSEQIIMVDKLVDIIDAENKPCVLLGDFNVTPENEILTPIYNRMLNVAESVGKKNEFTYSSLNPQKTIDYIFVSKHFKVNSFTVKNLVMSDHYPVIAETEL